MSNLLLLIVLATNTLQEAWAFHGCPEPYDLNTYLESCYRVETEMKQTFQGALEQCQADHGHFAHIGSDVENAYLFYLLHQHEVTDEAFFGYRDGAFVDSKDMIGSANFTFWDDGHELSSDCGALTTEYSWADADCDAEKAYICQIRVKKCPECECNPGCDDEWAVKTYPCLEFCQKYPELDLEECISCCSCCETLGDTCVGFSYSNELKCAQYYDSLERVLEVPGVSAICEEFDTQCSPCDCDDDEQTTKPPAV